MKIITLLILSIALIFASCSYESPPTQNTPDGENQILKKKPQPGGNPTSELISFVGDLAGSQVVEDCCPNAGPFPEYIMTLEEDLFPAEISGRELDGNIFMNTFGRGKNKSYIVQFWTESMFLEIIGGEIHKDKRTKTTTVSFADEPCDVTIDGETTTVSVSFVLTRAPAPQ
jgi:hypothetical protein